MKTACFIPIKANSERVPGKNFRRLCGKKLYEYICGHIRETDIFNAVYVDTDSDEIASFASGIGFHVIERRPDLASNEANGNDLLVYHMEVYPDYDFYFQAFATAPFLQPETIRACCQQLISSETYDSCFTATEHHGFYWLEGHPMNYRPGILPRSQDLLPILEETTGFYGISRNALQKYHCRIGRNPYIHLVNKFEAVDINTPEDFQLAEYVGEMIFGL